MFSQRVNPLTRRRACILVVGMDEETKRSVAKSLEANAAVLPYLPELLVDLWDLGCSPDVMVEIVRPLELTGPAIRVLDLGCGKGAAGITLAARFGFRCLGIDGCDPFLEDARRRAKAHGVADLCEFRAGDIRTAVRELSGYDVVIYASVGDVLGSPTECIRKLRGTVRPGRTWPSERSWTTTIQASVRDGARAPSAGPAIRCTPIMRLRRLESLHLQDLSPRRLVPTILMSMRSAQVEQTPLDLVTRKRLRI